VAISYIFSIGRKEHFDWGAPVTGLTNWTTGLQESLRIGHVMVDSEPLS